MDNMDIMGEVAYESSYRTPFFNSTLLPMLLLSLASQKHSPATKRFFRKEYDYIVVGAGSAGATLASRLSEVHCVSVLLLEAGKAPPRLTEVPAFAGAFHRSDVDWGYYTVPQKYTAKGFVGRKIKSTRGKMLGGSSSLNGNQYVRGNRKDYDLWAAGGAAGWSFNEVLPYFKKMEDNVIPELVANGFHGIGGPLTVSLPTYESQIKGPLFEAHRELGLKETDINGHTQTGYYDGQETTRFGQRCSTAKAYLVPRENAPNLDIVANAFVTKVIIQNSRATGVQFDFEGQRYEVASKREVILSAGAMNTPQILMLSGIGPAKHLEDFGIPVLSDLPVGLNFHDHCAIAVPFELGSDIEAIEKRVTDEEYLKQYIDSRSGPLSINYGNSMGNFINEGFSESSEDFPTLQLYFSEMAVKFSRRSVIPEIYNQVFLPYENKSVGVCTPIILRPKTRGAIKLQSVNPYDSPVIDHQYLEDSYDLELLVEGMKACHLIIKSSAMQSVGSRPFTTKFPGCEREFPSEDRYFRCVARLIATSGLHQVGSAKMGAVEDQTTVVDPQLRVKTIEGLRVVDASVMPDVPTGNTNVPTIMIAEKAADMIKETIQCFE